MEERNDGFHDRRGRPRKNDPRDTVIGVRLNQKEKDTLDELIDYFDMSPGEVLRYALYDLYSTVFRDHFQSKDT